MVIPWSGSTGRVIKRFEPTSKANYVEFTTPRPGAMQGSGARSEMAVCRGSAAG